MKSFHSDRVVQSEPRLTAELPVTERDSEVPELEPNANRMDVQGLRAIAVLLVVAYHAKFPLVTGGFIGVDLFFVLSGFLITGLLLRELRKTGRICWSNFWARRIRRLLPASMLVLVLTLITSNLVLPLLQRTSAMRDIMWSALFSANWHFAIQQTDYLAGNQNESPVLHFWSLGVEEQFYVFWPLLLGFLFAISKSISRRSVFSRLKHNLAADSDLRALQIVLTGVISFVIAVSFGLSLKLTAANQPFAYFGSTSRIWQLASGGLLAVWFMRPRKVSRSVQQILSFSGFLAIIYSAFSLHESEVGKLGYPGYLALAPTFAGVALVLAGSGSKPMLVQKILSIKPMQLIGKISYSWYLLHWPFLVFGHVILGSSSISVNLILVALSFPAAWAVSVLIENPLRYSRFLISSNWRSMAFGATSLTVVLALGLTSIAQIQTAYAGTSKVKGLSGAYVQLRPSPANAPQDFQSLTQLGCSLDLTEFVPNECEFGDVNSDKSVILLGDSHASAIFPVVNAAAKKMHWKLNVWEKNACPLADVLKWDASRNRPFSECDKFREIAINRAISAQPNLVILTSAYNPGTVLINRKTGKEVAQSQVAHQFGFGLKNVLEKFNEAGISVVYLHEPPYAPFDPPSCLIQSKSVGACLFSAPKFSPEISAVPSYPNAKILDIRSGICNPRMCNPVKSDVLVYRDRTHMTKTYVMTLEDKFLKVLSQY